MTRPPIRIAVDGPAASGKGTVARRLARVLGYTYVDTGTIYRTIGMVALERGIPLDDEPLVADLARALRIEFSWEGDEITIQADGRDVTKDIRSEDMGTAASRVSRLPEVRSALLGLQRQLAGRGGVVMDGRDIGSVVLPDAELKVFLDASLEERTRRRLDELAHRGIQASFLEIYSEVERRDASDRERAVAPLRRLPESFYVDTTGKTIDDVVSIVMREARARGA